MASAEREAAGLAYVCTNIAELRDTLHDDGADPASILNRLLAAVRDGTAVTQLLDQVHRAAQQAGDELGIYGEYEQNRGPEAVGTERMEIVFLCPLKKCMGRSFDEVKQFPPRCSVDGVELVRHRLS